MTDQDSVNHSNREHSPLSASGSERWTNCVGSAAMEELIGDKPAAGDAAKEGTQFHELCELMTIPLVFGWNKNGKFDREVVDMINRRDLPGLAIDDYPSEMHEYSEQWIDLITGRIKQFRPRTVLLETKVHLDKELGLYGTADCLFPFMLNGKKILEIDDLKYGKGHAVEADSLQLKYYGLAAEAHFGKVKFDEFWLNIYQPRADHPHGTFRKYVMKRPEADRIKKFLIDKAKEARALFGLSADELTSWLTAGDHCVFCAAKGGCRVYAEHLNEAATLDFTSKDLDLEFPLLPQTIDSVMTAFLPDEQIAKILTHKSAIEKYITAVQGYAINRCLAGHPIPGFKVVRTSGKSRFIKDQIPKTAAALQKLGIKNPYEPKLKGIGAIEAELNKLKVQGELKGDAAKKHIRGLIASFIEKPLGSLTLVLESDPRRSVDQAEIAASDFVNIAPEDAEL